MNRNEATLKMKASSSAFVKIIIAATTVIILIYVLGLAVLKYTGDSKKIDALEKELNRLNIELSIEKEKSEVLNKQFLESQALLQELTVAAKKEVITNNVHQPIIDRAKSYTKSDTEYVNNEFIENIFVLSEAKNVNPYVVFAIIDVESNWDKTAKNKSSSAYGIGQVTKGTGDFIHYNLMRSKERYNHEILAQPMINVEYVIEYLSYLKNTKYRNYDGAIKQYCGGFVKGHEKFYETNYRNKIVNAMVSMGVDREEANTLLSKRE